MSACAIIVSYNTGPALGACLRALADVRGLDEVVLVDNGNSVEDAAALDAFAVARPKARVLRGQGNVGFAAACNLAAREARAETLVFVNPDVILEPGAVEQLSASVAAAPPPAIVGGDLRDGRGRPERGSRRERLTLWRAFTAASGLSRLERVLPGVRDFNRHADPLPRAATPVGAVSGALMAMRRADFETLGGFDEGYFLHVEDIDICRRAEDAGWRVLFQPGPHGVHVRSTSVAPPRTLAQHKARGMARYFRKFAKGPFEKGVAIAAGALLIAAAPLLARR